MTRAILLFFVLMQPPDIGRRIAAALRPGEPIQLTFRSLVRDPVGPFRPAIESALREHTAGADGAAVTIALSESAEGHLLVAEITRDGKREAVFMQRVTLPSAPPFAVVLAKTLLARRDEPILDATAEYVLTASAAPAGNWPRDLRGRIAGDRVFLPGVVCERGAALECRPSDEPWPGWPGAIAAGKNTLADGHFSAARVGEQWHFGPGPMGDDIAAVETSCGTYVLGTPEADAIQAFAIRDGQPAAASAPLELGGTVTALWQSEDRASAVAIAREANGSRYAAYTVTVACSR